MPIPENEPAIPREDCTPTLADQCAEKGWQFGFYNFGKGESRERTFFNPGLIERPDGLWLLARVSEIINPTFGQNSVFAFELDETGTMPKRGVKLKFTDADAEEHHEDARAAYFPQMNQTAVCCTNFKWYGRDSPSWSGAMQVLGFFDADWNCKIKHRPGIGGNPASFQNITKERYEKSWMPFFAGGKLNIFYSARPWRIYSFGRTWNDFAQHEDKSGVAWPYGTIRNGTPPIKVGDELVSFFHSSLPWKGSYRRYYMGAVAFESEPPFKPLRFTPEPLLAGSQNDPWALRKPPCVFPCGCVVMGKDYFVTIGVNDLKSAWVRIPIASLAEYLKPIADSAGGDAIFAMNGLSPTEERKQSQRLAAQRAREALAKMRADGTLKKRRGKRMRSRNRAA